MLAIKEEVAIFREDGLLVLLQTQLPALIDDHTELVVLFIATTNELIPLAIVDIEKIVCVLTSILDELFGKWSGGKGTVMNKPMNGFAAIFVERNYYGERHSTISKYISCGSQAAKSEISFDTTLPFELDFEC